jgi:hypothetical protein
MNFGSYQPIIKQKRNSNTYPFDSKISNIGGEKTTLPLARLAQTGVSRYLHVVARVNSIRGCGGPFLHVIVEEACLFLQMWSHFHAGNA